MIPHVLWFIDGIPSLAWVAAASAQAAVLIVVVLALRAALGRHLPPGWRLTLWLIVLLRLVVPLAVESRWSLAGVARHVASMTKKADVAVATAKPQAADAPHVSITYGPIPSAARDSAATPASAPVRSPVTSIDWVADGWLAGVALLVAWQVGQAIRLHRAIRRMRPIRDASLLALVARCASEVGVRQRVRLVETDRLRAPAVCGIVRPTILLPVGVAATLSPAELRLVLLHELAHVRRGDALAAAIARLVRAFHWFNPFVWIGVHAFRADREFACDAAVLRVAGDTERHAYGECLLHVVERISGLPRHPATLGVFGSARQLQRRIDLIAIGPPHSSFRRASRIIADSLIVVATAAAAVLGEPRSIATTKPGESNADIVSILATRLPALRFEGANVETAAAAIAKASGVPIHVEWAALEAAGVSRTSTALSCNLQNGRLDKVLDLAFGNVAGVQGNPGTLDYEVVEGAIVLSTANDIASRFGGATLRFVLPPVVDAKGNEQIVALVTDTVDPDSWREHGGKGTIEIVGDKLIATNTPRRLAGVENVVQMIGAKLDMAAMPTTAASPSDIDRAQATLDRPVGINVAFDRLPFFQAIEQLRARSSAPVFVNWAAVEGAGIARNKPVTLRLPADVQFGKTLSVVLDAAGGGVAKLAYAADDGVITISTREDIAKNVSTVVYDIRDLLVQVSDVDTSGTVPATSQPTRDESIRQITDLIEKTIEPDDWKVNGGLIGAMQELSGQLIVTATPRAQREILALLTTWRRHRSLQVNVEARFVAVDPAVVPTLLGRVTPTPAEVDRPGDANKIAAFFLDDAQTGKLLRSLQLADGTNTLTTPKLTLFNARTHS